MRVTPAMAIRVTSHLWDLPEFLDALLTAKLCETPAKQPIAPRRPATTARQLPNGRGSSAWSPARRVPCAAAAGPWPRTDPRGALRPSRPLWPLRSPPTHRQLDLLSWRPRPPPPADPSKRFPLGQLGLDLDPR